MPFSHYLVISNIVDAKEYVKCEICGQYVKSINAHIKPNHNINKEEYINMYPYASMYAQSTIDILREKSLGENNPMHKSKTTEEQRKQNSPFSIDFYKKRFPELSQDDWKRMVS